MSRIAPSILAADFARLGEEVAAVERGGADRVHVDVMDGHFVPNLSMGPAVVRSLRPRTRLSGTARRSGPGVRSSGGPPAAAGSDRLIVHHEVLPDPRPLLRDIHARGKSVGMAVNPETPVEALEPYLAEIDLALCMTVHPGFGGQAYRPESPERIRRLRALIDRLNPRCELEVDGGIDMTTGPVSVRAGATVLVAGTAIFCAPNGPEAAARELQNATKDD